MITVLDATVTKTTGIESISITQAHGSPTATATITATETDLGVGDRVVVHIGWVGHTPKVFEGYVKNVEAKSSPEEVTITAADDLVRAVDYFIAASNPNSPLTYDHIKAEDLIEDLLSQAGLNKYYGETTNFTFGIRNSFEVNLTSVYDYCKFIADILAYSIFCDTDGIIYFVYRPPFPDAGIGDVADYAIGDTEIITIDYSQSDKDLRNRIVVYGAGDIHAEAKASSPYLPDGFYKTMVVAAPTVIDSQGMAQDSADYNLPLVNRLTKNTQVTIKGNPNINCRDTVTLNKADLGATGDWYVYSCTHNFNKGGYTTELELRQ